MQRRLVLLLFAFSLGLPSAGLFAAAEAGQPGGYLRAGLGARAAAMGNALAALAEGPEAGYWNPAALAWGRRPALASSLSLLSLGRQFNSAGLQLAWDDAPAPSPGRFPLSQRTGLGSWGLTWLGFSLGDDFEGRSSDTASFYRFSDSQSAYLLGHGRPLTDWLALGLGLRRYERVLETYSAGGFGLDLGALLLLGSRVRLGVSASDLLGRLRWSTGYEENLPAVLRSSLSAQLWQRLRLAAQVTAVEGRSWQPGVGLELEALRGIFGRMGWTQDGLTAGGGLALVLRGFRLQLDYAYLPDPLKQGDAQRFDLSLYF